MTAPNAQAPVDVLARIRQMVVAAGFGDEVALAVADLIEADKAYDDAMARHYHAIHYGRDSQHLVRCAMKAKEAAVRRAAALARVSGGES